MPSHYSPGFTLYHNLWILIDWVFPPSCAGCGRWGDRLCPQCVEKIEVLPDDLCPKCSLPSPYGQVCSSCQMDPPPWQACRSWAAYRGPVRSAIHRLKYQNDLGLCEPLSQHLVQLIYELGWPMDCIVPVPLNPQRRRERGYNQSAALAKSISLQISIPCYPAALVRTKNTRSQVGLNAEERRKNLDSAFTLKTNQVVGKSVLLLDDVMTTGATLRNAANALLEGGASRVYALTLARALLDEHSSEEPVSPTPIRSQDLDVQQSS